MLYLKSADGSVKIIVLESANLDELRKGRPAKTPDGSVLVCWTPDPKWLADQLAKTGGDTTAIGRLIDEASRRPEQSTRPYFESTEHKFGTDINDGRR